MKKWLFVVLFLCSVTVLFAQTGKAEISFTYTKINKIASNQFAVWVEDAQGRYVKTLYATRFTAAGGWKKREQSIPLWVKQSNLAGMNKTQVDAITGPTPKNGTLRYSWDGTDSEGRTVPAGEYKIFVEASLYYENRVLYTAVVRLGEGGQSSAQAQYFGTSTKERDMIGPVTVTY